MSNSFKNNTHLFVLCHKYDPWALFTSLRNIFWKSSVSSKQTWTMNSSYALIFTCTVTQYGIPYAHIHSICMENASLTPDVIWKWNFTLFLIAEKDRSVIWPWDDSQVRLSLCLSKSEWHIEVVANLNAKDPMFLPSHSTLTLSIVELSIDRVMPCPVMNCPLKAGQCWTRSVPLPLEYPGKIMAGWCIVRWKAARVFFV